jgi:hypothetical protein
MAATRVASQAGIRVATATRTAGRVIETTLPLAQYLWNRIPPYTLPTAATIVLIAGAMGLLDPFSTTRIEAPVTATRAAETPVDATSQATRTVLRGSATKESAPTRRPPATDDAVAPAPATDLTNAAPGALTIFSRVPLDIEIGGRAVGSSESGEITLPPGQHDVRLVNTRLGYQASVTLEVKPSALTSYTATLPEGQLQVDAAPGSEVWIEGALAGVAPLGAMAVPIGTREIVIRHPEFGEQREFVEVLFTGVTHLDVGHRDDGSQQKADFPLPSLSQPGPTIR